jgi:hypothetical protein
VRGRLVVLCALIAFCAFSLEAEPASSPAATQALDSGAAKEENPFSRFEIVSLGAVPIVLFYTDFAFDLQRCATHDFSRAYAPWPIKDESYVALTQKEVAWRLGTALGLSFAGGAVDGLIHASKLKAAKRLREARQTIESEAESSSGP